MQVFRFALYQLHMNTEQTGVFIKLLTNFHAEACANKLSSPEIKLDTTGGAGSVSNNNAQCAIVNAAHDKLQKDLLAKSVEFPPDQVRIFSLKEMEAVNNYIYNTYSRTLLFYRLTFSQF